MECNRLEHYLNEHEGEEIEKNSELHNHSGECRDCKEYRLFDKILHSQKEVFEKAPETLLPTVQQRIREQQTRESPAWLDIFRPLLKPALAFSVLLIAAGLYMHLKNSPIGVVDNLAERFNISDLRNIKTGDVLYVAKQINVDFTLNGNVKLEMDSNTVLQVRAKNKIALFRGQLHVAVGKKAMKVETPNGVITLRQAKIKVHTTLTKENGNFRARTSCYVFDGNVQIGTKEKSSIAPGQEIELAENGGFELKNASPSAQKDREFSINPSLKSKVFTAKEQLCDCLYDIRYNSDNNPLHGREMKENKFPVRIFWLNKEKFESMRRLDEKLCFFIAGNGSTRHTGNSPGI
jgi:hypothetical protein